MRLQTLLPPPTRLGLLPEARHVVLPAGIITDGFPAVRETCKRIGIQFDPWQLDLNKCILAKAEGGMYAADTVAISIPRQVGKTFDIGAVVFALCIANPRLTVIWTAHRFKVSRETFNELRGLAKSPKLAPHLEYDDITTAAGNECIPFRNESRIVFAARERGAIRGFTKVGVLILDEAQILTEGVLADLAPTMNQATNPLIIMMGTPPKPTDPGEVFTNLRTAALAGESEGVLYVELSAPADADPDDPETWKIANPSFPTRTPARAISRLRKLLSHEDFLREALGIWDLSSSKRVISEVAWNACLDSASKVDSDPYFAVDVSPDRSWAAIAAAGTAGDRLHVEVTSREGVFDHRPGTEWLLPRLLELKQVFPSLRVAMASGSAAESLKIGFEAAGIGVDLLTAHEVQAGCGLFFDDVMTRKLAHLGQEQLDLALASAKKRIEDGETGWIWGRKRSTGDITALYAATLAVYAATEASNMRLHPINNVW